VVPPGASLTGLQIPIGQTLPPKTTSEATFRMNLDAAARTGSTFNSTMQVYDSRGTARTMNITFTRQANGSFDATATIDGQPARLSENGGAPSANPVAFTFDTNGNLTSPTAFSVVPDQTLLNGATLPSIAIQLRETNADGTPGAANITSYSRPSAVSSSGQDGYTAGELNGVAVDPRGIVYGIFSNGQSRVVGQYAVATFSANAGLTHLGGSMYGESIASGQANIGIPGTGGRGAVAGGYLEQSNVDITTEFVALIEAQRGFQANSRVITTLNQTFQDLLRII